MGRMAVLLSEPLSLFNSTPSSLKRSYDRWRGKVPSGRKIDFDSMRKRSPCALSVRRENLERLSGGR
jgi:hypothetical protein